MKWKKFFVLCVLFPALYGHTEEIYIGFHVANNQWNKKWVYTSLPELGLSFKYLTLGMDGTLAGYSVYNPLTQQESDYLFRTRISLYSMIRIPLRSLFFKWDMGWPPTFKEKNDTISLKTKYPDTILPLLKISTANGEWQPGCRFPFLLITDSF